MEYLTSLTFTGPIRKYDIRFRRGTTLLLRGNSAAGKSLMCYEIFHSKGVEKHLDSVFVIDAEQAYGLDLCELFANEALYAKYSMFVIDNSDILITPEVAAVIREHLDRHWIFIGRRVPECLMDISCIGELEEQSGVVRIKYV